MSSPCPSLTLCHLRRSGRCWNAPPVHARDWASAACQRHCWPLLSRVRSRARPPQQRLRHKRSVYTLSVSLCRTRSMAIDVHNSDTLAGLLGKGRRAACHFRKSVWRLLSLISLLSSSFSGATQGLFSFFQAFVNPGDEVIVIEPFYDSYVPQVCPFDPSRTIYRQLKSCDRHPMCKMFGYQGNVVRRQSLNNSR